MTEAPVTPIAVHAIVVPSERMRRLRPELVAELVESITAQGLLQPVVLRPRGHESHWLVAGRHRLEAVRQCGHTHIRAVVLDGLDADAALLAEIDENLVRADLSPAERAMHLSERKRLYLKKHPETASVRVRGGPGRGKKNQSQNATRLAPAFIDDTAKKTGKHRATIAREVARGNIVGLADVVGTTLDEAKELDALAKLPEPVQRDLISRVKTGEPVTAKHVAKKLNREARERELAEQTEAASAALDEKRYAIIYADPPWRFALWAESGKDRVADNHYPTMTTDAIKALPVPATDDCVLFLWATAPMLDQNIEVLKAWGFTYKSLIVWKKPWPGTGYWVPNTVEILLIGTRGNPPAPTPGEQPPQVIEAPRGRHSEKPAIFAEHIERLFPNVPKLEMFARKARPGFDVWGNEAPLEAAPNEHAAAVPISDEEAVARTWTRKKA